MNATTFTVHNSAQGFTPINNCFLNDKNLSNKACGLLARILSLPKDWKINIKGLSTTFGGSKDQISTIFKELKKLGYMRMSKIKGKNNLTIRYHYDISDMPIYKEDGEIINIPQNPDNKDVSRCPDFQDTETQDTENQDTENQDTENQDTENQDIINTNEPNTNEPPVLEKRIKNFKIEAEKVFNENKESFKNVSLKDYLNYWCECSDGEMMFKAEKAGSFNHFNRFVSWSEKESKFGKKNGKKKESDKITDTKELKEYFKNKNLDINNDKQQIEIF